jgi:hypothetical protein
VGVSDDIGGYFAVIGGEITPPFKMRKNPLDGKTKILIQEDERKRIARLNLVVDFLRIFLNELLR